MARLPRCFAPDIPCHLIVRGNNRQPVFLGEGDKIFFHRCLAEDGVLVLNLPAYRWLMSRHDAAVYNVRRYTRRGLARLLEASGFRVIHASYWNAVLFPVMVLTRKLLPGGGAESDVGTYPAAIELLCRAATGFERTLLRRGLRLPFGGSVITVAAKRPSREEAHD